MVGMKINSVKTKVLAAAVPAVDVLPVTVDSVVLEEVPSFVYLGSTIMANGQSAEDVIIRVNKAHRAFGRLHRHLWSRKEIRRSTKIRIYQALIRSILLYGCETWAMRKSDIQKVDVFDRNCIRRILNVNPLDHVPNPALYRQSTLRPLSQDLFKRRVRWFGHALRRQSDENIHMVIDPEPPSHWKKRRGGQLRTWLSTVKKDMERLTGPTVYGIRRWNRKWLKYTEEEAKDRGKWAALIRDALIQYEGAGSACNG